MLRAARMLGCAAKFRAVRAACASLARHSQKSPLRRQRHRHAPPRARSAGGGVQSHARRAAGAVCPACARAGRGGRATRACRTPAARPTEMDAVLISTCTGYLCPGLTSYVSERLGLRPDVFALDLVGQGCGAALPNLRTAEAIARRRTRAKSFVRLRRSLQRGILSRRRPRRAHQRLPLWRRRGCGGAGAAKPQPIAGSVEWKFGSSCLAPDKRDTLRFGHKDGMLRNILLPQVPQIAGDEAAQTFCRIAGGGRRETRPRGGLDFAHRRARRAARRCATSSA